MRMGRGSDGVPLDFYIMMMALDKSWLTAL
jgi:hypothetical protein